MFSETMYRPVRDDGTCIFDDPSECWNITYYKSFYDPKCLLEKMVENPLKNLCGFGMSYHQSCPNNKSCSDFSSSSFKNNCSILMKEMKPTGEYYRLKGGELKKIKIEKSIMEKEKTKLNPDSFNGL